MKRTARILMLVLAIGLSAALAAPAVAQKGGNSALLTLTCNGSSYEVTIERVNGDWVPARDTNSTLVFHPTAFGEVTRTFYPADGSAPQTQTSPSHEFKTQQQSGHPKLSCTFRLELTDSDGTLVDTGTVSGWIS